MDPQDCIQNVDSTEATEACLRNHIALSTIFENFSSTELIQQLSLVNKSWNYEARSLMKKRGNVIASITYEEHCLLLESFGTILSGMSLVPFAGMQLHINFDYECSFDARGQIISDEILDRMSWTNFSVQIGGEWLDKLCPALLLAKRILHKYGGVLEELKLDLSSNGEEFIEEIVQDCSFPRLKILKLGYDCDPSNVNEPEEVDLDFMKALVSRAPNLQEMHSGGHPALLLSLMEVSSAVLVCSASVFAPFDDIPEGAVRSLRFKKIELEYTGPEFNFERFNRIAPFLLQTSCTKTLCCLRVDTVLAVALMSYGLCFENVKDLTMIMNYDDWEQVEPRIFRLVKYFDFTRTFPTVSKVTVVPFIDFNAPELLPDHMNTIIERTSSANQEPMPGRAANITEVNFTRWALSNATAQFYSELFPSIQKIKAEVHGREEIPFGYIWKNWLDLKHVEIIQNDLQVVGNLDSVFCGIFPEEVAELREKGKDYLLRVNIVPVMPAFTCLKNLRTFKLLYNLYKEDLNIDDPTAIFSKVTVLTAFARYPGLGLMFNFPVECWS